VSVSGIISLLSVSVHTVQNTSIHVWSYIHACHIATLHLQLSTPHQFQRMHGPFTLCMSPPQLSHSRYYVSRQTTSDWKTNRHLTKPLKCFFEMRKAVEKCCGDQLQCWESLQRHGHITSCQSVCSDNSYLTLRLVEIALDMVVVSHVIFRPVMPSISHLPLTAPPCTQSMQSSSGSSQISQSLTPSCYIEFPIYTYERYSSNRT